MNRGSEYECYERGECSLGISAGLFDLLLSHLIFGHGGSQSNVESHGTSVEGRLLRHQTDAAAIVGHIELGDGLTVDLNLSSERVAVDE